MNIYRDDKRYLEIEKIRDYELTECISFEMAIRNKIVQKSILEYLALNNSLNYNFTDIFFIDYTYVNAFKMYFHTQNKKEFLLKIHEIMLKKFFFIDTSTIEKFDNEILNFIYNAINNINEIDEDYFECEDEEYENTKPPEINSEQFNTLQSNLSKVYHIDNSNYVYFEKFNHTNLFNIDENKNGINMITQKFSRPSLTVDPSIKKNVYLTDLNFNLPKKEFLSYIESIYDFYQNTPLLSKNSSYDENDKYYEFESELLWQENTFYNIFKVKKNKNTINLNEDFDLGDFLKKIKIEFNGEKHTNTILKINTIKTSKDWADCFYIYDYIKLSKTFKSKNEKIKFIIESLDDYYEEPKYKRNAIMDRYKLMIDYIEQVNYKNLLTG